MVSEGLKTKGVEMRKVMGILLFVMVAGMALAQQGAVVATADGIKITEEDLVAELRTMNVQQAKQMLTEQGKVQLLNRVIRRKLVLKAAKDAKADTAEAVKRGWQRAKDDVLINYMVAMKAQEVPKPTEEEAKSYYDKNDSLFFAPKAMHIQRILDTGHPWLEALVHLHRPEDLEDLSAFPEEIAAELERIREAIAGLEYAPLVISPLYYARLRYYDSLIFRLYEGNTLFATGGTYRIDEVRSAGFALLTDAVIAKKMQKGTQ